MGKHVVAILNPASGSDEPVLATLSDVLGPSGVDWEARVTTGPDDARTFAEEARKQGADLVLAYGGDGTVSDVATALAGGESPMAILPGGTGNAVAQELGIPGDLRAALDLALDPDAVVQPIDCVRVRDRCCLLRVGIGADARMIEGANREAKDRLGWFAYLVSALAQVRDPKPSTYRLDLDGSELELEALSIVLANIGRMGRAGMRFAEDVDPCDGLMDVFVIRDASPASVATVGASLLGLTVPTEESDEPGPYSRWRARRVQVEARPAQEVHVDGDLLGETPLDVRVEPAVLRILVPNR